MRKRVAITGMGVVAPNAIGLPAFEKAIRSGVSGVRFHAELQDLGFRCQIAGEPQITPEIIAEYFTPLERRGLKSSGIVYGVIAGIEAWSDAGLTPFEEEDPESGIVMGTGILGVEKLHEAFKFIDQGNVKRLGSTSVLQTMSSGISAFLGGKLGCGNQVTTNSSACTTGTESVLIGYERIVSGKAKRMLVGSCGESGPYVWGGFDALRILPYGYNDHPEAACRPMSSSAAGMVPGSGAGALVLEDLDHAIKRGAKIYAEVLGGCVNSGGQRNGGSLTAPNSRAVISCIKKALIQAQVDASEIDSINGHLTATNMDVLEIENWTKGLGRKGDYFPLINSLKGMTGHCLSASGSLECVASVLQINKGFVFGNRNCEDLHPKISKIVDKAKVLTETQNRDVNIVAKASFGFGDVNAVIVFKKFGSINPRPDLIRKNGSYE